MNTTTPPLFVKAPTSRTTIGVLALEYRQLVQWTIAQPEGAIVGRTSESQDCPCNRCIIDLGLVTVPEGAVLKVLYTKAIIQHKDQPEVLEETTLPGWLSVAIDEIDHYGRTVITPDSGRAVPISRERLLAILFSTRVAKHVPKDGVATPSA